MLVCRLMFVCAPSVNAAMGIRFLQKHCWRFAPPEIMCQSSRHIIPEGLKLKMSVQFKFLTTAVLKSEVAMFLEIGWTTEKSGVNSQQRPDHLCPHAASCALVIVSSFPRG